MKTPHQSEKQAFARRDSFSMAARKSGAAARIEIVVARNSSASMSKAYSTPAATSCQAIGGDMSLLCFDISSGGISAALLDSRLEPIRLVEGRWAPAATLALDTITSQFRQLIGELNVAALADPVAAVSIGSFMHNFILLDSDGLPLTPVFTWLDSRGEDGVRYVRARMGERFHARTGCRYHPMFPVFKLAALHLRGGGLPAAARAVSVKSFLL